MTPASTSRPLLFDSHAHLVADDQVKYPRNPMQRAADAPYRAPGVIGKPGGHHGPNPINEVPDALRVLQWMKEENVDGIVAVQKRMIYRYDNSYILDSSDNYPDLFSAVVILDGNGDARRRDALDMGTHQRGDDIGVLIGHEPEADFRHGDRRQDGLGSLTGVPTEHAVHFTGRARPEPLERGVSGLPAKGGNAHLVHELLVAEWQVTHLRQHGIGERSHIVVEAGNGDAPVGVMHAGEDARECHGRIDHGPTVHAGVEIAVGPAHGDLEIRHPTQ